MKKVICCREENVVNLEDVDMDAPIFVKKDGRLVGIMTVNYDGGWYIDTGVYQGIHQEPSRVTTMRSGMKAGFTFHIE